MTALFCTASFCGQTARADELDELSLEELVILDELLNGESGEVLAATAPLACECKIGVPPQLRNTNGVCQWQYCMAGVNGCAPVMIPNGHYTTVCGGGSCRQVWVPGTPAQIPDPNKDGLWQPGQIVPCPQQPTPQPTPQPGPSVTPSGGSCSQPNGGCNGGGGIQIPPEVRRFIPSRVRGLLPF